MPQIAHYHDFAATSDGYRCLLPNCTTQMSNAQIASNLQTTSGQASNKHRSVSDLLNEASKKAGNS